MEIVNFPRINQSRLRVTVKYHQDIELYITKITSINYSKANAYKIILWIYNKIVYLNGYETNRTF